MVSIKPILVSMLLGASLDATASAIVTCDVQGVVDSAPVSKSAKGAGRFIQFKMKVAHAERTRQARSDSTCKDLEGERLPVILDRTRETARLTKGQSVAIRYWHAYQESGYSSTRYDLLPLP